uniref:Protein kinase domain-containing protein n=1 Tax=Piliocolobus tephrosceles TaxID=591936 RepID=A0A8C9HGP3_9PRIM
CPHCPSQPDSPRPSSQPGSPSLEQVEFSDFLQGGCLSLEIGRGFDNLTSVHLAWHTPAGALVTIKVTNLENCNEERLKVLQKAMILSHFFWHPNITTYWTVFSVDTSQLLRAYFSEGMGTTLIRNILFGAVRGLNYLHQYGCIHRSSKASHILISDDGLVTLSGLSHLHSLVKHGQRHRAVYDFPQFSTSVQPWLSPELLRQDLHGYNVKSDIYSVGITTCELASRQVPFQDMKRTQMLLQKLRVPPYTIGYQYFPSIRIQNERFSVRCRLWDWSKCAYLQWNSHSK